MGIKRQKRELGYATEDISGEDLTRSGSDNVINSLSGRAAGVQIITSDGVAGGSSRIVIRGNNSIFGDNQPLIVGNTEGLEHLSGIKVVKELRNDTCGEPHGEYEEEVEGLAEEQSLLRQRVCTEDGYKHGPKCTVEGKEEGVCIGVPEHIVLEHDLKRLKLYVLREEDYLSVLNRLASAYCRRDSVEEGVYTADCENGEEQIG